MKMNINKHLFILMSLISLSTFAQSKKTLNYQAVILDPNAIDIPGASITGQPLNKGKVCLRFSLLSATGGLDYEETQQVVTDEYGLVSVAIGTGTQGSSASTYKTFNSIVWNANVKSLKVSVSYDGCSSFKQVSTQIFNYTPYALYAEAVDYNNVRDAPTKLSQFSNDAGFLIPKDLDPLKSDIKSNTTQLQVANQTIAENKTASDAAFLVVNQSLTSLDKLVSDNTSSITTMNSRINDQQNQIFDNRNQLGGLQGQLNQTNSNVSNLSGAAEMVSNKSRATDLGAGNPSDELYPSQKATKTYVDQAVAQVTGGTISDATTLAAGKIQLAGDLSGTATNPTVPALAGKENTSNKSTATDLGAGSPSDQLYPSQRATKAYVDNSIYAAVGAGVADATTMAAGKVKLAGDLAGTAASPTVPGLLLKEDLSNKSNGALGTSTTLYPTQNAVKTYVDAQVASATIVDADATTRGKIQLAGDLAGSATSPSVIKLRGTPISSVAPTTAGHVLTYDVNGSATWAAPANSANTISGVVPVANGGTGLSTLTNGGAVYASSSSALTTGTLPLTAGGTGSTTQNFVDLTTTQTIGGNKTFSGTVITSNLNTDNLKVTGGTIAAGSVLISDASGNATWGGSGLYSLNGLTATTHSFAAGTSGTDFTVSTSASNGTAVHAFNLPDASAMNRGVVTIGAQTFGGAKTFTSDIKVNGLTIGMGASAISSSTAMGYEALNANTTGIENTAVGYRALKANTTGSSNLAFGNNSLKANTTGSNNTAIGNSIMTNSTTGGANTAVGSGALQSNTNNNNTAVGYASLLNNNAGNGNTAVGVSAMQNNVSGTNNTALGYSALQGATGSYNTAIGNGTSVLVGTSTTNATAIGNGAYASASNMIQLGNTSVTSVKTSGTITAGTVTYPNVHNSVAGQILMTDAAGVASWTSTRSWTDQPTTVSANQTAFTLTYAPPSTVKVWMFINGVRTNNNAYTVSGTTVTYIPASNGGYTIMASDRVQFDYTY